MSIPSINGVGRVSKSTPDTPAPATASRTAEVAAAAQVDDVTQQPVPPRFPWLSRLSQQLESAAKRRAPFPHAPVLGDHLDRSA